MHAYLLIGRGRVEIDAEIESLAEHLKAKVLEFPIAKIDDVRSLNSLTGLSFERPTLIVCKNIHEAGEEAANSFLKNLEEPQENVYFALTAPSAKKVMPTIVSRCNILRIANKKGGAVNEDVIKFIKMSKGEKLSYVLKIKDREKAVNFTEDVLTILHKFLHDNGNKKPLKEGPGMVKYSVAAENIRLALKTLSRLKGGGNVNLQLSNFVINYN